MRISNSTLVSAAVGILVGACSLLNREGPDVTCAGLANGAENACADGIIATCINGSVRYKVCKAMSVCSAPWQTPGRFRCEETDPTPFLAASGGGTPPGGNGDTPPGNHGSTPNGSATVVAVCGTCPSGYLSLANACNRECGGCECTQKLCVRKEQIVTLGQDGCKPDERSILSIPDCGPQCGACGARHACMPL